MKLSSLFPVSTHHYTIEQVANTSIVNLNSQTLAPAGTSTLATTSILAGIHC